MRAETPPTHGHFGGDSPEVDDELLVAYLDGELEASEVRRVEAGLASSAVLRARLEGLRKAWDMLVELPTPQLSPNFAQSTIEMVAVTAESTSLSLQQRVRQVRRWLLRGAALVASFFIGYLAISSLQWSQERQALSNLPLLADWEALKRIIEAEPLPNRGAAVSGVRGNGSSGSDARGGGVGPYEWLQMLLEVEGLAQVVIRTDTHGVGDGVVPDALGDRRTWIAELDRTARDRLSANYEAFTGDTRPEEQRAALELAQRIYRSPDRERLLEAARNYAVFLSEISSREREGLVDLPADERLEELQRRVNRKLVEVYCQTLPDADRETVRQWIDDMEQKYSGLLRSLGDRSGVALDLSRRLFSGQSEISDVDLESLLMSLSDPAQEVLGRLEDDERERWLIQYFVGAVEPLFAGRQVRRDVDRETLEQNYNRRPEFAKSALEFRTPQAVREELTRRAEQGSGRAGFRRGGNGSANEGSGGNRAESRPGGTPPGLTP
jgi:hypothetical protein